MNHHADGYHLDPRLAADSHPVASFELCELRLMDDANYPWLVLVPRLPGARELIDLDRALRRQLTDEIRSEEHTSELQSLMRISYAVFCLHKTRTQQTENAK